MSKANSPASPVPAAHQDATTSPATTAAPQPDKHLGTGGLYSIVNGERVLLSRTKAADDASAAASPQA